MLRMDTECLFFYDSKYQMYVWTEKNASPDIIRKEVTWAFRILEFLGAPTGFVVNFWRIPNDRELAPNAFPTRAEVNGGWAYPGRPEVFIFRTEEWDRVLIHECIHALLWDVEIGSTVKTCLEESLGQGSLTDALFEAATELNAEWMWCVIHAPRGDNRGSTWIKQQLWQSEQAHHILARSDNIWSEDTSVFAYYVLKAVLALDMKTFLLDWLASTVDTNKWCLLWKNHKYAFLEKAKKKKGHNSQMLSMRMTNPAISS
jgi:hypothetical protein